MLYKSRVIFPSIAGEIEASLCLSLSFGVRRRKDNSEVLNVLRLC